MNSIPVRLFHAFLSGALVALLVSIGFISSGPRLLATSPTGSWTPAPTSPPPSTGPLPTAPLVTPTPNDLDGDGIPNSWETAHSHNPNDFTDSARDFDKDGLTALQEYQLSVSSGGNFGNPLGKWKPSAYSFTLPQSYLDQGFQYLWPSCANDRGEIAVAIEGEFIDSNGNYNWRTSCALIKADGSWLPITLPGKEGGNIYASDMDENGNLLLQWYSEDWSQSESHRFSQNGGSTLLQLDGENCVASRMNNHGDWIGWSIDKLNGAWNPVHVIDGRNVSAANSSTYWQYLDINDYGEVMGTYYDPLLDRNLTFLEYGPFFFSTGRPGDFSFLDGAPRGWMWPAAMNNWGEFAGGSSRYNLDWSRYQSRAFFYDGEYRELNPLNSGLTYAYPLDVSDHGQVLLGGHSATGHYGAHLWSDHISMAVSKLWSDSRTLYPYKLTPSGDIILTAYDSTTGSNSLIVLRSDDDADEDGMPDDWEAYYGLNPSFNDANADLDGDGTNNLGEFLLSSNPTAAPVIDPAGNPIDLRPGIDTDGDGIPNTWEWANGLNYNDALDAPLDFDRDGYTNRQEFQLNTDPRGAPSYRIREIGPFPDANSISLSSATLGSGTTQGVNVTESVFFTGTSSTASGSRPASWSFNRADGASSFSFFPPAPLFSNSSVAQSTSGAVIRQSGGNPNIFHYWSSPTTPPISLSGAAAAFDVASLSNPRLSPSGVYLVATRRSASNGTSNQPIVWKMPVSGQPSAAPVRLLPPAGVTLSDYPLLSVNDHGFVIANGAVGNQSRPILWKIDDSGMTVTSIALPPLSAGTWAAANGLSNQSPPWIAGTSTMSNNQQRAVAWDSTGAITNLGTLTGGNSSSATHISPMGKIAGRSNVLVGTALKHQPFVATFETASGAWQLQGQGEPQTSSPSISSINDAGEVLGTQYHASPVNRHIPTIWRHGRGFSLADALPVSSGYNLASISAIINSNGTLLASAWKDGVSTSIILTPDRDTDGDGLPDAFENQNSLNAFVKSSPTADTDGDGLTDLEEYRYGTHLRVSDTDGDGMKDGWEVSWGLLPLDPSDADLDPDNDRVTNLRESQIGTSPTGIYQIQERFTDTSGSYPTIISVGEDGEIIHTGQSNNAWSGDGSYYYYWNTQEFFALPAAAASHQPSLQLPYFTEYGYSDQTSFEYQTDDPKYWVDSILGKINGALLRSYQYSSEFVYYTDNNLFLIPDVATNGDESNWISWNTIIADLKQGSTPRLAANDYLDQEPLLVSPSGTRRIHRSQNSGMGFILNESGGFVATISLATAWQFINDHGEALALVSRVIPAANGVPATTIKELRVFSGGPAYTTQSIPDLYGPTSGFTLRSFSNDGKALLSRTVTNHQFRSATRYFLFDIHQQTLTQVRQPNLGNEAINLLSLENQRLVGSGPKPFQITPDGTCIRLEALRIKPNPTAVPVPLGSLYTTSLTPSHIASDGRITATTTTAAGQTVLLQINPYNDADNDELPDDWETAHSLSDPDADADGDEMTNAEEFFSQSNPQDSRPPISNFRGIQNTDGTITYTWISFAYPGEWFRIRLPQPGGTYRTVFETTYGSSRLPHISGKQVYSLTLNPASDYNP